MTEFINQTVSMIKDVFLYIFENDSLVSLLAVIVGWFLNNVTINKQKKKREKELNRQRMEKKNQNKPELYVEKEDKDIDINLEIFIGPFNIKYDENKKYEIEFPKSIKTS